jgi:LCP family protein required for cell wall assembly
MNRTGKKSELKKIFKIKKLFSLCVFTAILIIMIVSLPVLQSCKGTGSESSEPAEETSQEQEQTTAAETDTGQQEEGSGQTTDTTGIEDNVNYYASSSGEFGNYSFLCPEGWKLYETDSGRKILLESTGTGGAESQFIFISVVGENTDGTVTSQNEIINTYLLQPSADSSVIIEDEEIVAVGGADARISGYSYTSKLTGEVNSGSQDVTESNCKDYFTVLKNGSNLYCIKYSSRNLNQDEPAEVFKNFLKTFSFTESAKAVKEKEKNSSVNILILGDDSGMGRPGGRVGGRTDIIIFLHLNLETCKGTAVTIPRDTWVNIPGYGEGKINGAHAGGNELTVQVIEELSGLEIDNYIITDFDGFIPLIDFLGGVTVEVGEDLNDDFSGCYLSKGVHHLDGTQALALSRNRHRAGDGTTQGGAFAREKEAAKIIVALLDQKSTLERILAIPYFINYLLNYTWTDMTFTDVIKLLPVLGRIKASDIEITGIPSWPQMVGNASAVVYDVEATAELFGEVSSQ